MNANGNEQRVVQKTDENNRNFKKRKTLRSKTLEDKSKAKIKGKGVHELT